MSAAKSNKYRWLASSTQLTTAAFLASASTTAYAVSIGAYAVGNHSSCGVSNIPGTIIELDKFFDSKDFPEDFSKNFYWKDARVKQSEWVKGGDYNPSSETNSGFDGSDSSTLTYIASHGVTSGGVYKALAGSKNFGGCYIPTTQLELGNNTSRYAILSTCQGLKIGTGDYPNSSGENPSRTWKSAAKGLNCIFGYSNNMADDDGYGEYFLANIKDESTPLSKAFMDASESVYSDNIPAVLCFGSSEQDAADYIQNNASFESESRPNSASSWVYRMVNPVTSTRALSANIPSVLRLQPKKFNVGKVAQVFLGQGASESSFKNRLSFSSSAGSASYEASSGTLLIRNRLIPDIKGEDVPTLSEAEQNARHALKVSGLQKIAGETVLAASAEEVLGGQNGISRLLSRKFTYRQVLSGATTLSQQGTIDVTVGPAGVVTEIKAALVDVDSTMKSVLRPTSLASRLESIELRAIKQVAEKSPGSSYRVVKYRIGYDAGNFHKANAIAPAVVEVTVEVGQGDFRRNFIEKVIL